MSEQKTGEKKDLNYWLDLFHSAFETINLNNRETLDSGKLAYDRLKELLKKRSLTQEWFFDKVQQFPMITIPEKEQRFDYVNQSLLIITFLYQIINELGYYFDASGIKGIQIKKEKEQ